MAMLDISATVTGQDTPARIIAPVTRAMTDFRQVWEAFRPRLHEIAIEQFGTEGARGGERWAPLSPAYAARKARTHPGRTILVRKGNLAESLISQSAPGAIWRASADTLVWGTEDRTAAYHQYGTSRMPRRQVITLTQADVAGLSRLATEAVMDIARKAGATA